MPTTTPIESGYKYILAYGIVIGVAVFISRSRIGYAITYYVLVLAILLVVVMEARFIADSLAILSPQNAKIAQEADATFQRTNDSVSTF